MSYLRDIKSSDIDAAKLGITKEMLSLLYDIGVLALVRSFFVEAADIFEGYKAVKPQSELARMGMGLTAMAIPNYEVAAHIFKDEVLKINPKNDIARAYLGMAQKEMGKEDDARKTLQQVIDSNQEESAVVLAKAVLERIA